MTEKKSITLTRRGALGLMGAAGATLMAPNLLGKPAFAQTEGSPEGRVIVGLVQEPTVFNPLMVKIEVDDGVHFSVFDALFRFTPEGEVVPNLATEVPTQANGGISEDGTEWRIKLRDDVKWHDGEPFTAEDVKFTLELIVNPDFRAWRTAGHSLLRDITVVSPTELTWRMEEPFSPYLSFLTETFIVPKHAFEGVEDPNSAPFNQSPIGTGAFKWDRRLAGDRVELLANADYHGEGPYLERLVFKYIPDITVHFTQFRSGDIDLLGRMYITPDNYEEAKTLPDRTLVLQPAPSIESIALNLERPQFKELAVREALYAAIDKQAIIDAIYYGVHDPVESYVPRNSYYYYPDLPRHEYSPDKANALLDEAGWKRGAGGIREKDGVRLSFKNSTTSGNHLREQMQQFVQQMLQQIGVEMTIENMPAAVMWGDFWMQSRFDTAVVGTTYLIGSDPDVTNRFHSSAITAQGGSGSNNVQIKNARIDELLEKGTRIFDPAERKVIYDEVQQIVRHELPFLPLFAENFIHGRKSGIEGFEPNGNTRTESWNAASWYWVS
ncbi:peptide ABC transporter substrate-binding protein [Afifella sp. JA880]|uniref:peptide ABC transporter substrate-binding protein n=1 Tax=Afifella sp. JA880 TaxID=2975280 RepID=UPI0021BB02B9|nr:peptide ABC transporter substrate-binding protein [Afifella sp. JA880]MCT8266622.1 peptide ABC transporter substrate-binding protein [Afifella sp. JA880]